MATDSSANHRYPGETSQAFPEKFDLRAMPAQPGVLRPGQLPPQEIRTFFEEGYLLVKDFFLPGELDACREAVAKVVDDLARCLFKAGKIKSLHEESGLFERLTAISAEFPDANVLLHRARTKHGLYQAFRDIWANERLLNLVEQLLGPDIMAHPLWNLRPKVPNNTATVVPWHQDSAYTDNDQYNILVATAWIPLLDADAANGCMEMVPRGHLPGLVARHVCGVNGTWYLELPEEEMRKTLGVDPVNQKITCDVPYGGLVLFNNLTPHRGLPNTSNQIRWSMDLRWMRPVEEGGWHGKKGLMMREAGKTVNPIDWDSLLQQEEKFKQEEEEAGDDMFEPVFTASYFSRWEIVDKNKHIIKYLKQQEKAK